MCADWDAEGPRVSVVSQIYQLGVTGEVGPGRPRVRVRPGGRRG
jgi:hypothetical protein